MTNSFPNSSWSHPGRSERPGPVGSGVALLAMGCLELPRAPPVKIPRGMNAILILNDEAGSLSGARDGVTPADLRDALVAAGISTRLQLAPPKEMGAQFTAAANERPDAVIVGGGDGTISSAAGCLAGRDVPLGVLPLGTLNHFAKDLGLPSNWREAVVALAGGVRRAVDVAEVNGRTFINNCSIGSYAATVRKRDALRRLRGHGKWWAMSLATLAVFRRLRRLRLRVETDAGNTFALRTPFLVVSNNRYSGRVLDYSLRPRLDEGQLWIYTTRASRHLAVLHLMAQSLVRDIDDVEGLEAHPATEATITRDRGAFPTAVDGELVALEPPLRFRIRPGALQVLAPRIPATE